MIGKADEVRVALEENAALRALLAQTQTALAEHQAALAVSEEARRRLEAIIMGKPDGEARNRTRNRGRLPAHLPRVERTIEPESTM